MSMILWIRCLFTGGHQQVPVQIVPTRIEVSNVAPCFVADGEPTISRLRIESPLTYCRKCGRLRYGP